MIVSKRVWKNLRQMREQMRFFGGLVLWMGFPSASVDVQHHPRFAGESSYSLYKLWKLGWNIITSYSDIPLRLMVRLGLMISVLTALCGLYIVYPKLAFGMPITGLSSLMASLYLLSVIIISTLGVVGIYLGKVFE